MSGYPRPGLVFAGMVLITTAMAVPVNAQMITPQQIEKKREKDKAKLLKLTPFDFQKAVELKDDDLETIATLTTAKGFRATGGLFDIQGSDVMLRAHVNKRTGEASYQVYAYIWYKETQERRYQSVNYQNGGEIGSATVNNLASRVISCDEYSATLGCSRSEEFVFPVSEELLESIAARSAGQFWRMKFRAQAGIDWEEIFAPAEAAGLLAAIASYKSSRGLD